MEKISHMTAAVLISALLLCSSPAICTAQSGGGPQSMGGQLASPAKGEGDAVLEIAPAEPHPKKESGTIQSSTGGQDNQNADDQGVENDVERYRNYQSSGQSSGQGGASAHPALPYLGISVRAITMMQPSGGQQRGLEVLSVDKGSPAAAAGIRGSGAPTELGASGMTASAMLGPAEFLMAPILKKTGQLGRQGDFIVAADDHRVGSDVELADELARLKPGETLWLTVLRQAKSGKPQTVEIPVKLGAPRDGAGAPSSAAK